MHLRIDKDTLHKFREVCEERYGRDHNDMMRELIVAVTEGRVKLKPSAGQQKLFTDMYETIYEEDEKQ